MSIFERRAKSRRALAPPPMTQADLYVVHVTGYYFCLACQRITELDEPGEPWAGCKRCGSHRVDWHPPVPCHDFSLTGEPL
jgi:DNA-directed RNA polymerase subunit RPC12/RpoP